MANKIAQASSGIPILPVDELSSNDELFHERKKAMSWIYSSICSLRGWRTFTYLKYLRDWQFCNLNEVREAQMQRLTKLLVHASNYTSYYRRVLGEVGVIANNIVDLSKFSNIPFLDKTILREHSEELISKGYKKGGNTYWNTSGGSTGEPAQFLQDEVYRDWSHALTLLFSQWAGKKIGDREIILWGSEKEYLEGNLSIRARLSNFVLNRRFLNTFRMAVNNMNDYVSEINIFKPAHILAYVESIYELARFIQKKGLMVFSPNSIMTSAGTLYPHMRETIEAVFQAPVFNRYGSREVSAIASECEAHMGLHICPLTHYVEIVRPDGTPTEPNEVGEIVITSLTNYSMPLIRYRIGDMGVWAKEPCSCGCNWPLLKEVTGRTNSILKTPAGVFDSAAIGTLLYFKDKDSKEPFRSFSKYQIIQTKIDELVLKVVVTDGDLWKTERNIIEQKFAKIFGKEIRFVIHEMMDIPRLKSGKYAYVISLVE